MLDDAAKYLEDKASSFLLNPDFDQQFSSCMQAKGYAVPTGVLPKLHALLPYLEDHALDEVKDWWTDTSLERAVELAFPEDAAAMAIWQEVKGLYDHAASAKDAVEGIASDHAAFAHALLDCALRSQAGGVGPAMTQILDAYPVPDAPEPLPPPEARPAVPVLPPPPPNWQPLVVPMDGPPAAKPKGDGAGKVVGGIIGMAFLVGAGVFVVGHLVAGGITPAPDPVVPPPSVTVLSAGSYACKTTLHGGFAAEMTCKDTVKIAVDGNVSGQGVNVLMDMPYGTLHGSAAVARGWRGTITVAMTSQGPGYACAKYPKYATTAYVYDGKVVNSGPLLAQHAFTYNLGCS